MSGSTVKQDLSLDEQYLDFAARAKDVFDEYPQLEPLRYSIFKEMLIQRQSLGLAGSLKHWIRPALRRERSKGKLSPVDVLIFIESRREVILEALLPTYHELKSRGIEVGIVSLGGPRDLPPSTIEFEFPAYALWPSWAKPAWKALINAVEELDHSSLRKAFYYACATGRGLLEECERILKALRPRVVLMASTQISGGAAMAVTARKLGISTHLLQHGILQPFYIPILADYMLTWGQSSNDTLERIGVSDQKMKILGSPRHDRMVSSRNNQAKENLLKSLSLPDRPTFAFFSNGNDLVRNGSAPVECANWLESTAARYSDNLNVIVKLHPNEDGSLYTNCKHIHVTKESPDLTTLLSGCDWVGSLCSTVLYDALIYKKPVWQFYADGWPDLSDNWKYGLAERVASESDLNEMTASVLSKGADHNFDERISEQVFANQGRATHAVADFVEHSLKLSDSAAHALASSHRGMR
jgi:hypothetical protein